MNKQTAMTALEDGNKLTHTWFTNEEWVKLEDGQYIFEDGCKCEMNMFWSDRQCESWKSGWDFFDE